MQLDPRTCYRALRTRDARFDGRFFTAVRSTGIYCRPVCPAPTPKLGNCTFLPSAAAAQERGYRPCLRCRPEAAPGTPTWLGTSSAVSRALRLIAAGALDAGSVATLAARLGIGDRHLRRLFLKHLGASPVSVAQTQRILFAKRLIDDTSLPMTEIASAAGFSSVRRFNDAIRRTYGRSPRELRRTAVAPQKTGLRLRLAYRPPFRWKSFVDYLELRATRGVESVDSRAYRRTVRVAEERGWLEVRPLRGENALEVELHLSGSSGLIDVADRVRRIFDLGAAPAEITAHLGRDKIVGRLARRLRGIRVPGTWDGFELAVRAVLGQQVTVKGASTLAARLADRYGEKFSPGQGAPDELRRLFPTPERLARADLTCIGLPRARAKTISALADAVGRGDLLLEPCADPDATLDSLRAIPGVGEWTAQYVAMRALGHPDAFPAADLGLRQALAEGADRPPSAAALERIAEAWRPWRAYAAFCLWLGNPDHQSRRNR
jgi:AraC family transcriptional regulator of adaptative response / DNA-3-methyladenine glycosylase II